jgi:hypothetical protein
MVILQPRYTWVSHGNMKAAIQRQLAESHIAYAIRVGGYREAHRYPHRLRPEPLPALAVAGMPRSAPTAAGYPHTVSPRHVTPSHAPGHLPGRPATWPRRPRLAASTAARWHTRRRPAHRSAHALPAATARLTHHEQRPTSPGPHPIQKIGDRSQDHPHVPTAARHASRPHPRPSPVSA